MNQLLFGEPSLMSNIQVDDFLIVAKHNSLNAPWRSIYAKVWIGSSLKWVGN